ncbi:MAG: hypothetical protein PWP76_430 [Candidatus Diapherotrites archaeon]|nr:hypothetical protein [Candidatus Diapherotrites archaeon]MDN5367125.1 hypothetical protein [Candidatus Diapherotrites archaeon]
MVPGDGGNIPLHNRYDTDITVDTMVSILVNSYLDERKRRVSRLFFGPPGIGKSMAVREAAKIIAEKMGLDFREDEVGENYFTVIDLRASQLGEADVRGVPFPDRERKATTWMLPDFLPREGQGILFLDEINLAPPHIQSQLYQLILERKVGSYRLPEGWMVVAAGNREEDGAFVEEMAAPLRNRMAIYNVVPDMDAWLRWAEENGIDKRVIEFVKETGKLYVPVFADRNFPSPRTWEFVSHHMDLYDGGQKQEWFATVVGLVGVEAALEFMEFLERREMDWENFESIWKSRPDRWKVGTIRALARKIVRDPEYYDRVKNVLEDEYHVQLLWKIREMDRRVFVMLIVGNRVPPHIVSLLRGEESAREVKTA